MNRRPGNYAAQAETFDRTRGASPSVVRMLSEAFGPGTGRTLADVAGGTGNYARALAGHGFDVRVIDAQPAMLALAAAKVGPGRAVAGDAAALPLRDASFDAVLIVSAIHLFDDPAAAFREARRVVRAGPFVVMAFVRENLIPLFVGEYFGEPADPVIRASAEEVAGMLRAAGFARVEHRPGVYADTADASLTALHIDAERLADPDALRNTSFWHRHDEATRRNAVAALRAALRSGVLAERVARSRALAERHGHFTVFVAEPGE